MIDQNEVITVGRMMNQYGGSFASNLGEALLHADHYNQQKIKNTWPELWQQYLEMGKKVKQNKLQNNHKK